MMRLTNVMRANTTLMHINRNMRRHDGILRSIQTGKKIQRPSDNPVIANRALMFRTNVHENKQYQSNVEQGIAWMNVTESTFDNINRELLMEIRNLAVTGASTPNNLEPMQSIIRQISAMFNQIGHEMNASFGGNYLFSGFRTDEPPVFTEVNNRSFIITQNFALEDIARESSFQRLVVPGMLGIPEPVSHNINVLKLAYNSLDEVPVIPGFDVVTVSNTESNAYIPEETGNNGLPLIHYIPETGELVMHRQTAENFPREGISVTYQKTGFAQGEINPSVYFTGREIIETGTSHIPVGTELIYSITQNFNRQASTGTTIIGGVQMLQFDLAHIAYENRNNSNNLRDSLPSGAIIDPTGTMVSIPSRLFESNTDISITYATRLASPIIPNPNGGPPIHIMQDTRVQGVELVRATNLDGIAVPLDQVELNKSFNMFNQEIQYEVAPRTKLTVNSLAKNVLTDKMFADFRLFFEFSDSIRISNEEDLRQHFRSIGYSEEAITTAVGAQITKETTMATDALHRIFNNMLYLIDRHAENTTREQTLLGARMVRIELVQSRLEQDEISYEQLTSRNEDTDLILASINQMSAHALLQASIMANANVIQMSLANFLR